jgi:hypothetical protein
MKDRFYMIYVEDGNNPFVKHETLESAEKEAKRLAEKTKKKTWVLCTLKSYEVIQFQEKDCRPTDSDNGYLPF